MPRPRAEKFIPWDLWTLSKIFSVAPLAVIGLALLLLAGAVGGAVGQIGGLLAVPALVLLATAIFISVAPRGVWLKLLLLIAAAEVIVLVVFVRAIGSIGWLR